ncbi:MAG: YidC/Oxa1 family rane protein insertase [Solirubrobacterales bacterium]|nr:YidC/Oxa1 family rane protein insertase [Solirubrobacterales bacterium]
MTHLAIIPVLKQLIAVFDAVIQFFHDSVGFGWGLSIIALTVGVRLLLLPLTVRQFRSMQAMQRLGPEMKKLQAKYKDDKQRLNQEMMKLYQEHQVNPFGSCLPLVAQMPVFISLFYMLRKDLKLDICGDALRAAGKATGSALQNTSCSEVSQGTAHQFLFINDITDKGTGSTLVILIVLYIGSQLLSSVLMSVTADKNQRMLMIALPFVFTIFVINFPTGLLVYWITTNLWTVGQQFVLRQRAGILRGPPPVPEGGLVSPVRDGDAAPGMPGLFGKLTQRVTDQAEADEKAGAQAKGGSSKPVSKPAGSRTAAPPPPPRAKKKKRSGRRR